MLIINYSVISLFNLFFCIEIISGGTLKFYSLQIISFPLSINIISMFIQLQCKIDQIKKKNLLIEKQKKI